MVLVAIVLALIQGVELATPVPRGDEMVLAVHVLSPKRARSVPRGSRRAQNMSKTCTFSTAGEPTHGGWMESWGRGIANIMDACKEAGLPKPEFIKAPWVTRIIFKFKNPLVPYLSGKDGNGSSNEPINEPINEGLSEGVT